MTCRELMSILQKCDPQNPVLIESLEGRMSALSHAEIVAGHLVLSDESAAKTTDSKSPGPDDWREAVGCAPAQQGSVSAEEAMRRMRDA